MTARAETLIEHSPSMFANYDGVAEATRVVAETQEDAEDRLENALRKPDFMEDPWGSFPQLHYARNMIGPNGGVITKITAYSFPCPPGTTTNMGIRIQRDSMALTDEDIHIWDGVEEGKMFGVRKRIPLQDGRVDTSGVRRLAHASASVIATRHQYKDHPSVQKFFAEHSERQKHMDEVEMHMQRILNTPKHLQISADVLPGMYGFVLEYIVDEDGNMWGTSMKKEKTLMAKIADDKPHQEWMSWYMQEVEAFRNEYLKKVRSVNTQGQEEILVVGHFNNTERVSDCGGNTGRDGCSRFFKAMMELPDEKMEKALFTTASIPDMEHVAQHLALGYIPTGKEEHGCTKGHEKGKCDCQSAEEEYSVQAD